jgi:hypothetical protein
MNTSKRNTTPIDPPDKIEKIFNIDIVYGPCTAIGGARFALLAVNKKTRMNFVFPLKNLTTSLHQAVEKFLLVCGPKPEIIRTDFDAKLIRGKVKEIFTQAGIKVEASPPYRQHQNGVVERHWQTIIAMTRNWLTSAHLPSKYWYFAVKRACEILNIMPIKIGGKITTPFEEMYGEKVDYRNLFPMFSLAYIKQMRAEGHNKSKWKSQTLKCIAVGKCNDSDSLLFYHPPSKQTLSCANGYTFDTFSPANQHFNEQFDANFTFNTQSDIDTIHRPPAHDTNKTVYYKNEGGQYIKCKVIVQPYDEHAEPYTLQELDTSNIIQKEASLVHPNDPTQPINASIQDTITNIPWIHHNAKVTMILSQFNKPKQGYLQYQEESQQWSFIPGRKQSNSPIDLPNFEFIVESMIHAKKLFKGWCSAHRVLTARRVQATSNVLSSLIINRKVSAKDLDNKTAPTLLKHYLLSNKDKRIWDASYKAEYDGLVDIETWEVITEAEYQELRKLGKGGLLPTMAISTIKYDGDGNPLRAKYRIVALGNLDPHTWSKEDCFAPVMSHLELRLLTALAVQKNCIPKTADFVQAFCQSSLPEGETYICTPPPGCPLTEKGTYLKLKKTLYGLKRSPRHFYELATKVLLAMGFQKHPTSHCLFIGHLIPNHPPIYLGLYVDDVYYFSESREVESKFEKDISKEIDIEFNGQVGYFLGINFECKRHNDSSVSILMNQESFIDNLVDMAELTTATDLPPTPYRSGYPVDKIPTIEASKANESYVKYMQKFIGCLNWLSISTRPDIATITNMIAKYTIIPTKGHIDAIKRVIKYLKGTKSKGILFTTTSSAKISAYVKFPVPNNKVVSMCDANWGPQDQSVPKTSRQSQQLPLFHTRSVSGFLLWLGGPLHWVSKRQSITARSSAESEIYATDECCKALIHLSMLIEGLNLIKEVMKQPTNVYNDNQACIIWSRSMTTKGLRHVQIRENAVREAQQKGFISTKHCQGKYNLSDMFTKEDKNPAHFIEIRDHMMADKIPTLNIEMQNLNARRVISVIHCSHTLLCESEGGVEPVYGQTL